MSSNCLYSNNAKHIIYSWLYEAFSGSHFLVIGRSTKWVYNFLWVFIFLIINLCTNKYSKMVTVKCIGLNFFSGGLDEYSEECYIQWHLVSKFEFNKNLGDYLGQKVKRNHKNQMIHAETLQINANILNTFT